MFRSNAVLHWLYAYSPPSTSPTPTTPGSPASQFPAPPRAALFQHRGVASQRCYGVAQIPRGLRACEVPAPLLLLHSGEKPGHFFLAGMVASMRDAQSAGLGDAGDRIYVTK